VENFLTQLLFLISTDDFNLLGKSMYNVREEVPLNDTKKEGHKRTHRNVDINIFSSSSHECRIKAVI
jgi:hypothetical protein